MVGLVGRRTNLPRRRWFLTIPASASGGVLDRAVARGEDPLTDYTRIRVLNSGRGKKSEPTDKTDISGISGFFIFIFYFFIFLFIF